MHISKEAEKLLIPVPAPSNWAPDEYDVPLKSIMKDWKETDTVDVAVVGIPFDTAVIGRRGCRFGPEGVRNAFTFVNVYEPGYDIDLSENFSIADFGNIDCLLTEVKGTHERVETVLTELFKTGSSVLAIGGDHSLTYSNARGLINAIDGKIGVINIDSHLDVRFSHHGEVSSGTPFRRLMSEENDKNKLDPKNFVEIGIGGWLNSKFYYDNIKDIGVRIIPAREVHRRGIETCIKEAIDIAANGTDAIFLSIDIDGLEHSAVPGTCSPTPGALTVPHVLELIYMVGQHPKCVAMDLLEVSPPLESGILTSIVGGALCMQFFGAQKVRKDNMKS